MLEHCTIPPYLCVLYSLDAARDPEAAEVVGSVLVEEMLHVTLAANLLNAVGGHPDTPQMLPGYPRTLPHGSRLLEIPLLRFGPEVLDVFLKIEQPASALCSARATATRRSASSTTRFGAGCASCARRSARLAVRNTAVV